jgi:hypothetical protein
MGEEREVYKVLVGKPEGKDHLEDQSIDGRMRSEWILVRLAGIRLAQDRKRWRPAVNAVMNIRVFVPWSY